MHGKRLIIAAIAILIAIGAIYIYKNFYTISKPLIHGITSELIASETKDNKYCIYIDLTESRLYLFQGEKLLKRYVIAYGKSHTPSPIGVWRIVYKAKNWGSGFGTRWMGLDVPWGIYGIHGTNKPGSIGNSASHGCIRMFNRNVEELYDIVPHNTLVIISGGPYGNLGSYLDVLTPGDRSAHVVEVQKRLAKLGYYKGGIDGVYGEGMKAALIRFKKDRKLPVTDKVDYATYKKLGIYLFE